MRFFIATILAVLVFNSFAAIDYTLNNQATPFGTCSVPNTWASPIQMADTLCAPYGSFSLTMTGSATGAPVQLAQFNNYGLAFTGATVQYNGVTWTSTHVVAHAKSEHVLPKDNQGDLELQVVMKNTAGDIAIMSFIVFSTTSGSNLVNQGRVQAIKKLNPITSLSTTSWNINFKAIGDAINSKVANDMWLNFFEYYGTPNFDKSGYSTNCSVLWLVYGSEIYADPQVFTDFQAVLAQGSPPATFVSSAPNLYNSFSAAKSGGTKAATRLCYTGYFTITLYANYGLWFGICTCLLFFIFTLSMDNKPIDKHEYQETAWTHHPLVSIKTVGNEIFTRKSRSALVYFFIINLFVWNSYWFRLAYEKNDVNPWNIIAYPLQTLPIGWGISYFIGFFLRRYYLRKHDYNKAERNEASEHFDNDAQYNIFIFYFLIFVFFWVCNSFTVWNMDNVGSVTDITTSNYWVASIFVGMALEWIIFDPFVCFVASKSTGIFNWCKWKGMIYDTICHDTYLEALKRD